MRKLALLILILVFLSISTLQAQTPTPEPTPEQISERIIRVWWPDSLAAPDNPDISAVLNDQVERFNKANAQYNVNLRLKLATGQGSILTTLVAAQPVAPSAIPDLVLLRRSDLVQAARSGVIRSIEDWVPDTLRADLLPHTIEIGQLDNTLYGLPYAITLQHTIYRTDAFEEPPLTFEDVLGSQQRFILPGLPSADYEVSDVILAQYLAAGGRLVDSAGVPTLDQEPLLEVLSFYAQGLQNNIFASDILSFSDPRDYWTQILQTDVPLAVVDSTLYLQSPDLDADVSLNPIPTVDGKSLVIIDGWLWALTTADPDQQRGALAFLEWMMSAETQADYTQVLGILPSRQRSLRISAASEYTTLVEQWTDTGIIIPVEQRNNTAAQQLQIAFEEVIKEADYQETANKALSALSASRSTD